MLREALKICKGMGLTDVMISCHTDNEGSRRTILANGGVYEGTVFDPEDEKYLEKYWIHIE
jgi:predicted acetyltransferase